MIEGPRTITLDSPQTISATANFDQQDDQENTAALGFRLETVGQPPEDATFFGLYGPPESELSAIRLTDSDEDGVYTGGVDLEKDQTYAARVVQGTGTQENQSGDFPGDPTGQQDGAPDEEVGTRATAEAETAAFAAASATANATGDEAGQATFAEAKAQALEAAGESGAEGDAAEAAATAAAEAATSEAEPAPESEAVVGTTILPDTGGLQKTGLWTASLFTALSALLILLANSSEQPHTGFRNHNRVLGGSPCACTPAP